MAVIKIKSTHPESQGDFVLIDEDDFDAETHELFESVEAPKRGRKPKVNDDAEA